MNEFKYYRAMTRAEFKELCDNDFQYVTNLNATTYWTNSYNAALLYCSADRLVVEITVDRDIPKAYHGIAEGVDQDGNINNHHEIKMVRSMMNDQLINIVEEFHWNNPL